jgi:hypothetical protein
VANEQQRIPFGPAPKRGVSFLREGAKAYTKRTGGTYDPTGLDELQSDSQWQTVVGQRYMKSLASPRPARHHPTAAAYEAMKRETHDQFAYLTKPRTEGGLGVNVTFEPEDYDNPLYADHKAVAEDILKNRSFKVAATVDNGTDTGASHPFLDPDTNNKFRAVHDAFGHAAIGRSFTRHGEEAAYESHAQMYSPQARRALATETRGQNSAMIYGGAGGFPDNAHTAVPDWVAASRIQRQARTKKKPAVPHAFGGGSSGA